MNTRLKQRYGPRNLLLLGFITILFSTLTGYAQSIYAEDFEPGDGGFTTTAGSSWSHGAITGGPGSAHSGNNAFATNRSGTYNNNENSDVISPVIDLSGETGKTLILSWWQFLVTEEDFDFASVEASDNGGGSWTVVYGEKTGVVSGAWEKQQVLLDDSYAVSNFRIRFHLRSDNSETRLGFYVDDISIQAVSVEEFL